MKKLISLVIFAGSVAAQTIYEREPNTGYCDVTAATNATPIRVTVADITKCTHSGGGALANGDLIAVEGVGGNRAANWNPGTTAGTTNHFARRIAGLSGNSFDLQDVASANVAGSGTYTSGGYIAPVQAKTLNAAPLLYLDGPTGSATTGLAAKYVGTNPQQVGLITAANTVLGKTAGWGRAANGFTPEAFAHTAATAMRYYMDNTATTSGDAVAFDLDFPEVVYCGAAVNNAGRDGLHMGTSCADYGGQTATTLAYAATLADAAGKLSTAQKTNISRFLWDGAAWDTLGGSDYGGASRTANTWSIWGTCCDAFGGGTPDYTRGTVSYTGGTLTLTGVGTSFLTDLPAGTIISLPHPLENSSGLTGKIASCSSNTSCTLTTELNGNVSGQHFATQAGWSPGKTGWFHAQCHYGAAPLCGASSASPASLIAAAGNPGGYGSNDYTNNLVIARLIGIYSAGIVSCSWATATGDYRGCWMAARASMMFHDHTMRGYMVRASYGNSTSTHGYNWWRVVAPIWEWAVFAKRSYTSGLDRVPQQMIDDQMHHGPMNWVKFWQWPAWGEHTRYDGNDNAVTIDLLAANLNADATLKQKWYDWYKNKHTVLGTYHYSAKNFTLYDPAQATTPVGTSWVANTTASAQCATVFGTHCVDQNAGAFGAFSKTTWASNKQAQLVALTPQCIDHCGNGVPQLSIIQGVSAGDPGRLLIGGGSSTEEISNPEHRSAPVVGSASNTWEYPVAQYPGNTTLQGRGNDDFLAAEARATPWYKTAANVTGAFKTWVHFKKAGRDFHVLRESVATSTGMNMVGQYLLRVNASCGTPSSSTCLTANLASKTFSNNYTTDSIGLAGRVVSIGTTALLTDQNSSNTDLSYTGGTNAGRLRVCMSTGGSTCNATDTLLEYALVLQHTAGSGSVPTTVGSLSGSIRTVEIQDGSLPAVAVFGPAGGSVTSGTFTTTHSGTAQYVLTNLQPGSISVDRGGTPVSGSPFTVGSDGVVTFDSASGSFSIGGAVPQAANPTFAPVAGTYGSSQTVTISTTTPGASIRYTTDGSTPTSSFGTVYSVPVSIPVTTTLKAIAYAGGYTDSNVTTGVYTITSSGPGFAIRMR